MINIAICDDDKEIINQINRLSIEYFSDKNIKFNIYAFQDASSFIQSEISLYDIIFLDIKINSDNGLDIAEIINKKNPKSIIILVSQYHEYISKGYKVKAFRYILKPNLPALFKEDMDSALSELNLKKGIFEYKIYSDIYKIDFDDIIYFESKYPKVYIKSLKDSQQSSFVGSIDDVIEQTGTNDFIRIGKSYLINAKHTKKISNLKAYLSNGEVINVSRDFIDQAKNNLLRIKRSNNWNI